MKSALLVVQNNLLTDNIGQFIVCRQFKTPATETLKNFIDTEILDIHDAFVIVDDSFTVSLLKDDNEFFVINFEVLQ